MKLFKECFNIFIWISIIYGMNKFYIPEIYLSEVRNIPNLILASIHPGTVYTKLSKPFIKESKCFSTNESAKKILKTIFNLEKEDSGKFIDYLGKVIPY